MSEKISRRVPVGKIGKQRDIPRFADGRPMSPNFKRVDEYLLEDAERSKIKIDGLPTEKVDGEGDWRADARRRGIQQPRFRKE